MSLSSIWERKKPIKKRVKRDNTILKAPRWTEQEEQYMLDHYKFKRNKDIAQHLGKTARSVEEKAQRMGLGKAKTKSVAKKEWHRTKRRWTQEEEGYLIENMDSIETKELAYNLGRTVDAVGSKLRYMRESF